MSIFKSIIKKAHPGAEIKHCTAIIVAGGSGTRMGMPQTKQMVSVLGIPVVARSMLAFQKVHRIKDIIVVAKKEEADIYEDFAIKYNISKLKKVTLGGATRQESVMSGFRAIDNKCDFVAIHDAARCLITPEQIDNVLDMAQKYGAATAACHAKDTVKIADENGFIADTPDRKDVWCAQTPQVFKSDLYRAASYYGMKKGHTVTDDNSLCEMIGYNVKLVDCGYENFKITTIEDLYLAEQILKMRRSRND